MYGPKIPFCEAKLFLRKKKNRRKKITTFQQEMFIINS